MSYHRFFFVLNRQWRYTEQNNGRRGNGTSQLVLANFLLPQFITHNCRSIPQTSSIPTAIAMFPYFPLYSQFSDNANIQFTAAEPRLHPAIYVSAANPIILHFHHNFPKDGPIVPKTNLAGFIVWGVCTTIKIVILYRDGNSSSYKQPQERQGFINVIYT